MNKNKKLNLSNLKLIFGIVVFKLLSDISYYTIIGELYNYSGFTKDFNLGRYIFSIAILISIIPIIVLVNRTIKYSNIMLLFFVYVSFIPFTTMVAFYQFEFNFIISNLIYWISMFSLYLILPNVKAINFKREKITSLILNVIIISFFITIFYISWKYTGFRITFDIFNVYELRDEALNFNIPIILSYIYSATKMVNPVLIVYYLSIKNYKVSAVVIFMQILSFSINGSKTVLFSTVLSVLLYIIYNKKYIMRIPMILALVNLSGIIEFFLFKSYNIVNFIIRRVFFVPNLLNYYYYDFFSINEPDLFKQSFLRHFGIKTMYPPIDNMIGSIYFDKANMGANNGLFSDAYSNLGEIGLLIMPIIIVLSLKVLDFCARGLDTRIYVVSSITLAFVFISSNFFTILFTHGFLVLCLVLFLLPRNIVKKGD